MQRTNGALHGVDVMTEPYPGFPTDLQAQMMALMTRAEGASMITETIFENRFMHVPELARMGANITIHHGASAMVRGVPKLRGAAGDGDRPARLGLARASPALRPRARRCCNRVYHLDRGYERLEEKLAACGADIERLKDERAETLGAATRDDLAVISAAVQDALVAVRDCAYFKDEKRFVLLVNRFRWEADPTVEAAHSRTHSALVFNEVTAVRHHDIPLGDLDRMLELLAVAQEDDRSVTLRFAAGRAIRLEIGRLACHLEDVGEPWPTPWKPAHPVE